MNYPGCNMWLKINVNQSTMSSENKCEACPLDRENPCIFINVIIFGPPMYQIVIEIRHYKETGNKRMHRAHRLIIIYLHTKIRGPVVDARYIYEWNVQFRCGNIVERSRESSTL